MPASQAAMVAEWAWFSDTVGDTDWAGVVV